MPDPAHCMSVDAVAERLRADPKSGLSTHEADRRLAAHGPNSLRRKKPQGALSILAHQVQSVIVWLLLAAAAMSFVLGDIAEGSAIAFVLALNTAIGFFTELKAARSMEALMRLAEVRTRVRRDGAVRVIDAQGLVPGDVVILEAGDVVTADLRLSAASNLQADESVLTGESAPVTKTADPVARDAALGDRLSMAFKGTAITQGAGEGIVTATGMATELGRISALAQSAESEAAPLERRLDRLGHRLVGLTLALAALTIGAGILRGHDVVIMVQTGVALAVAAVPEGLPVVATLSLARGMWRMSRRNALITRLSSVETLGATTVILTDKTGTLTENRMTVTRYLLATGDVEAPGPDGPGGKGWGTGTPLDWALRIGVLCNNAELGHAATGGHSGDPMEIALLRVAAGRGLSRAPLLERWPEVGEHAFHSDVKMMATVHAQGDRYFYAVKGAAEAVLDACSQVLGPDGATAFTPAQRAAWAERTAAAARDGLRLLALAMKDSAAPDAPPYEGLTLVGLVCLSDPLREDVPAAIAACRAAGVRVVMLTGDHADTALTIARQAGLGDGRLSVLESGEIAGLDADTVGAEARARILAADVFARVAPETKLTLVTLYQRAGHVVAMTGDGVNDAPALKKADIGIAMGQRGTQVAQEAAHMVLRDDAFATITEAMRQGRVIFDNIRKFVVYLMSCNVSEVLVVGLAVGAGLPTPLLPLQILFLNLVTDVFPAFALGLGKGDEGVMQKPPRDPSEPMVDRARWGLIAVLGALITLATLGAFAGALYGLRLAPGQAVTVAFLTLALAQLWNVFNVRDPGSGLWRNEVTRNGYVWGAITLCLALIGAALWVPPLAALLGLPDPGREGLALALGASLAPLALGQVWIAAAGRDKGTIDRRSD
ncbi:cation-translocating P-type ATPase [Aestuariicoccus sp. MJ-SS9]|uniref:cation-translocating P-type ATPase n=1 Tax=Aestuariicoccus sp. MJ-SS9 TaxID=3079855 RepID=UPI00290D32A8|nr:cation-translocating P-type ATPase [Aestuariicoccus sp. MJ-SS9]MDU8913379.1 cation-translocating P-type ATPase [Aestuariicoccus sp. MJ-SS9]